MTLEHLATNLRVALLALRSRLIGLQVRDLKNELTKLP